MVDKIVVGIDGSDASRAALAWAVDEARLWDARLVVVHAYEFPPYEPAYAVEAAVQWVAAEATKLLESEIATVVPEGDRDRVEAVAIDGSAAQRVLQAAGQHDLIAVGSRGRGGFASLLLGSVSAQVVQHAPCPVAVLPAGAVRADPTTG
ncbi:MAG: universal stress protein [Acidimicrobiia bacterium]|nr:universal stress protein [Acidimicrobiia bacterium]